MSDTITNTLGMQLVSVNPGSFRIGAREEPVPEELTEGRPHMRYGDFDELPAHTVTISRAFYIGARQVTNAEYEAFDPEHRALRGKLGFSKEDDEAVVFVSWYDAVHFCEWLSETEGKHYRLPTEAEWEYACRAGTTTHYHTGDVLPAAFLKNARQSWYPCDMRSDGIAEIVPLHVGRTPPNPWGLYDMHGNVEEWCHDGYGPYEEGRPADPIGRAAADFRVTRGGSHSVLPYYLRSANRSAALPEDRSWLIGFRVVQGDVPRTRLRPPIEPRRWQVDVHTEIVDDPRSDAERNTPIFLEPRCYVKIPADAQGPLYGRHNHDPAIAACPNGDLLAIWYSCVTEQGRELTVAASRLRHESSEWDDADPFWGAPDRNNHAPALWCDENGTLHHFNGMSAAATWGNLATIHRTSRDYGITWSPARTIMPEHRTRQMPVANVQRLQDGAILLPCDAVTGGVGGTATWLGRNGIFTDPGGTIAGIHGAVVERSDGRLLALGRNENVDDRMPMSISEDVGQSWTVTASPFPPISSGQRCVLLRLAEGPILFISFTSSDRRNIGPMPITDASGSQREVRGLFAALSLDEGQTWPHIRLVSDDGPGRELESMDGVPFTMGFDSAEPGGYMAVCQSPDGMVHLISSRLHYAFNLAWLRQPPPAEPISL